MQRLWQGGETLQAHGAGAQVPTFDITTKAPSYITITSPPFPTMGNKLTVNRAQPFTMTWTGGTSGNVWIQIAALVNGVDTAVSCTFPATAGTGTVATSSLSALPVNPQNASIYVVNRSETQSIMNNWGIWFDASTGAKSSTGTGFAAVTIQ
jgi:hypothetical protein